MPGKHYREGAGKNDSDQKQKDLPVVTTYVYGAGVAIHEFHDYPTVILESPALNSLYIRIICRIRQQA
jgi:hypothetical protein